MHAGSTLYNFALMTKLHENYQACEDHATVDHKWDMYFKNHSSGQEHHIGFGKFLAGGNNFVCDQLNECVPVERIFFCKYYVKNGAWGGVVVKALRY